MATAAPSPSFDPEVHTIHIFTLTSMAPGEHLFYWCGSVHHHGITDGKGDVFHMEPGTNVTRSSVWDFVGGRDPQLGDHIKHVVYRGDTPEKKCAIAVKAEECFEKQEYTYFQTDHHVCDGFVFYCRYNRWRTTPIEADWLVLPDVPVGMTSRKLTLKISRFARADGSPNRW